MTTSRNDRGNGLRRGRRRVDAYRVQLYVLYFLAGIFVIGAIVAVRNPLYVAAGLGIPVATARIGNLSKGGAMNTFEALAIWGGGTFAVFFASIIARFPMTAATIALVALNSFLIVGAWALHRLPSHTPTDNPGWVISVRNNVLFGLVMAVGFSILAGVILAVAAASGSNDPLVTPRSFGLLTGGYFAAGVLGGLVVGLLKPFARWPLGTMCIGIPVATLVYGSVGVAMLLMGDPEGPSTLRETALMAGGIGILVGPVGGLVFRGEVFG